MHPKDFLLRRRCFSRTSNGIWQECHISVDSKCDEKNCRSRVGPSALFNSGITAATLNWGIRRGRQKTSTLLTAVLNNGRVIDGERRYIVVIFTRRKVSHSCNLVSLIPHDQMSTFELKFFTLAWNEAETFIKIDLCLKVWKKINFESSALFGLEKPIVYC